MQHAVHPSPSTKQEDCGDTMSKAQHDLYRAQHQAGVKRLERPVGVRISEIIGRHFQPSSTCEPKFEERQVMFGIKRS